MSCSEILGELPLYVGDDLESSVHESVDRHLESCEPCREALALASAARTARLEHYEGVGIGEPPVSLWPALRGQLVSEGWIHSQAVTLGHVPSGEVASPVGAMRNGTVAGRVGPQPSGRLLRFLPLSAAAAGIFFLGILAQREFSPAPTELPSANSSGGSIVEHVRAVGDGLAANESSTAAESRAIDPECFGTPLRPVGPAGEFLSERSAPFFGEVVLPFNAFHPGDGGNNAASYNPTSSGWRRDGLR